MAAKQLVESEIEAGKALVRALDSNAFDVQAALWLYSSDTEAWRFVIATPGVPQQLQQKYLEAAVIISNWRQNHPNEAILDLSNVRLVGPGEALIVGLRPIIQVNGLGDVRFSNNLVNGVYVEDALIHRMAA